jgi:galactonate dehydratase
MKITKIETIMAGSLFVRIHTNDGLTGLGMAGRRFAKAVEAIVKEHEAYLIGKDPLEIERHWQHIYRYLFFRGGPVLMSALSAIDTALWDIAGKHYGVPVHRLLGGPVREKVRVYAHLVEQLPQLVEHAVEMVKQGITAVRWAPFEPHFQKMRYPRVMQNAVEQVRAVREAVGDDVDICLDFHGRLDPFEAVTMMREVEKYRPFFVEDPILPENIDEMADVAAHTKVPIATGERLYTIHEFMQLLSRKAARMVRPDILLAGGFTGLKKIAATAEACYVGVVPHLNPIVSVHLDAAIYNFTLQEGVIPQIIGTEEGVPLLTGVPRMDGGYILVPDRPGLGIELNDEAVKKYPSLKRPKPRFPYRHPPPPLFHEDGSFAEW